MKLTLSCCTLLAAAGLPTVSSFPLLWRTNNNNHHRHHPKASTTSSALHLAADQDNTMNSYTRAMKRMKFMQPDPHMGGLGGGDTNGKTSTKKDEAKTPTSTTQHEDMLIHHYHTEDETMAAYMDAMAQAQRNNPSSNSNNIIPNGRNHLPVQDVEIVDDADAVPTGRTSLEEQVDFAAQSFFDEKEHLEAEAAKEKERELEAAAKEIQRREEAAAKERERELEAAAAASLAAEKKRLKDEAARKKEQELAVAAAAAASVEKPPPHVAPQVSVPVKTEEESQAVASQADMPRSKLMKLAMEQYLQLGGPIDAELATTLPTPVNVVGGIPKGAEVRVAAEDITPQSVFEAMVHHGEEVLLVEDAIPREKLMETAMKKYKEIGPIDAELAKTLPKPTGVVSGIPKGAEVLIAAESVTPQSVFDVVVQLGGDVLQVEDALSRDTLMELAMKKYKEVGPIDAKLAEGIPKPTGVDGGIPRGAEVAVAGVHASPQSVFEVVVQMGGDVLPAKDAPTREELMEFAVKKFEEIGPIDAELAKNLPKPSGVKGNIPLAAEVVAGGEHVTRESIFQAKVQMGGEVLSSEDSTSREKLMEIAMKKYQECGPIDANLAKSRNDLMVDAMQKYREIGPIDAKLAKTLPKLSPLVGGIPKAAEVVVAGESATPESIFVGTAKTVSNTTAADVVNSTSGTYDEADSVSREDLMEIAMKKFKDTGPIDAKLSKNLPKVSGAMGGIPKVAEVPVAKETATPESLLKSVVELGGVLLSAEGFLPRGGLMELAMKKYKENGPIDEELARGLPKPTGVIGGIPKGAELTVADENRTLDSLLQAEASPHSSSKEWTGSESSESVFKQEMDHAMYAYSNPPSVQLGGVNLQQNTEVTRDKLMEIAMKRFKEAGSIDAELSKTPSKPTGVVGGIRKDTVLQVSDVGLTPREICKAAMPSIDASDPVWTGSASPETSKSVFKQEMDHAMQEYSNRASVIMGGNFLDRREAISRDELMNLAMENFTEGVPIGTNLAKKLSKSGRIVGGIPKDAEIPVSDEGIVAQELCQAAMPLADVSTPVWTGSESSKSAFKKEMDHATYMFSNPVSIDVGGDILPLHGAVTREQLMLEAMEHFKKHGSTEVKRKAVGVFGGIPDDAEVPVVEEDMIPDSFFELPMVSATTEAWVGVESSKSAFEAVMNRAAHDFENPPSVTLGGEINTEPIESLMESAMEKFNCNGSLDVKLASALTKNCTTEGVSFVEGAEVYVVDENTTLESILEATRPSNPTSGRAWIGSISSKSAFKSHMDQAVEKFLSPVMVRIGGDIITGKDVAASEGLLSRAELMETAMLNFIKRGPADAELSKDIAKATGVPEGIPFGAEVPVTEESTTPEDLWNKQLELESFEYDTEWFQKVQNGIPPPFQFVTQDACWSNSRCWGKLRSQRDSSVDFDVVIAGDSPDLFAAMSLQLKGFDVCLLVGADLDMDNVSRQCSAEEVLGLKELGVVSDDEVETTNNSTSIIMNRVAKRFQVWGGTILEQSPLMGVAISEYAGAAVDLGEAREVVTASLVIDCLGSKSPMACQERYGKGPDDGKPVNFSWSRMLAVSSNGLLLPLVRRISDAVSDALETQRLHKHDMAEINSYLQGNH